MSGLESSGKTDSGVTSRVIGQLMSWWSDTQLPIYKIATCNTIRNLDAAILRRGRWDQIFGVGLPTKAEREQIFSIHLHKRHRDPQKYNLSELAILSEGFVGAEIESAVEEALYHAFDLQRDLTTEDIVLTVKTIIPISKTDKEAIQGFQEWMRDRAVSVSSKSELPQGPTVGKGKRQIRAN